MSASDDGAAILYSRGRDTFDAYPEQRSAASFDAFADAVLSDRSRAKGQAWISAPFKPNSDGRHHRCRDGVLPRRFLAFDLDGGTPPGFAELCMWLTAYSGLGYTTSSHTSKSPHARFILELSRAVDRPTGIRLGEAMQQRIEGRLGSRAVKLDPSVYRGEQPLYGPLVGAEVMRYDGDPIDVDAVLKDAPPLKERPQGRPTSDPYRAALLQRGLVLRELGPGKDSIVCPFAADHTEATSDTATVYFWPRHGGYQWGGIHCLHEHCAERNKNQRLYIEKLGLDPRSVWRGQADDLPPVEVYAGDAAQEGARTPTSRSGNGAAPADCESRVVVVRGDALRVEPIRWVWDGWLARGKLHMLAGAPGAGKSTISLTLAAVLTVGGRWPDGTKCTPGHVLVWSGEDDPSDTLLPRLLAAGGDPKRFHIVSATVDRDGPRQFDPATDIPALLTAAREIPECGLVIVDPVVTVVPGDSHKNSEVRRALQPLVGFASELDAAVFGVSHFTKGTAGRDPVDRVTGSVAFGALPRVVMAAARVNEGDVERRIFCRAKSNIGLDMGGWEYRLVLADVPGAPGLTAVYARWGEVLEGSARDLLAEAETTGVLDERSELEDAQGFLRGLLADGPVASRQVRADADGAGYSWATVRRAQKAIGIEATKEGGQFGGGKQQWLWRLPDPLKVLTKTEGAHTNRGSAFSENERLQGRPCPRCDGEGCRHCGGMGRLVDDQPEEPAATSSLRLDFVGHDVALYACRHWHYSRNLSSAKNAYLGVWEARKFAGAVVFGIGSGNAANGTRYGLRQAGEVAELTRVALRPGHAAPVSRIVAIALRLLRRQSPGLRLVISFADTGQGHHGGIYQAGSWIYTGDTAPDYEYWNGRYTHRHSGGVAPTRTLPASRVV